MIGRALGWAALVIFSAWLLSSLSAAYWAADSFTESSIRHADRYRDDFRSARESMARYPTYMARTTPRAEYNADGVRFEPGKPAYDPNLRQPSDDRYSSY